ncbi:hypothetical protein LRP88_14709 [Fusarium phalaenopsidis]
MSKLQNSPGLVLDWARPNDSPASDLAPLGIAQARLLLVFFTGFSGQPRLIRQALVGCGHVSAACDGVSQGAQWRQQPEAPRVEAALSQCRRLLTRKTSRSDAAWDESDGPLLFNTSAVLRVSYGRAFMTVRFLDRSLLFNESAQDMVDILKRYFEAVQERDQFVTLAVNRALEGFAIPIRAGRMLMRKTAAFKWSVEHVLAGWDAGLLVTKWVHTIEQLHRQGESTAPEERQVLENVRHLLNEGDIECTRTCSLAAELARAWAGLYDDTWVWGGAYVVDRGSTRKTDVQAVAPRIGWALRELANMYQRHLSGAPWRSVPGL